MDDRHARHRRPAADRRRRPIDGYRTTSAGRFARLLADAVATLPPRFRPYLEDVEVTFADMPPHDTGEEAMLGVYQAVPAAARQVGGGSPMDRIVVFRRPLEARAQNRRDLVDLTQLTVADVVAEHAGLDDDWLDDLGSG